MKNSLPAATPSGVKTSIISSVVPAGTVVTKGTVRTVPVALSITVAVVVARRVRVPVGNVPVVSVYRLTVTGCPAPAPSFAISTPNETEVTLYCWELTKAAMLNALQ